MLVFPTKVNITLFSPQNQRLNALSVSITPHILSGGYFTSTSGASSPTLNAYSSGVSLISSRGQALISSIQGLANTVVSNPLTIFERQGLLVADQSYFYQPTDSANYGVCNGSIVRGVVTFDFNSGNTNSNKPSFQLLNLGIDPLQFSMPTLSRGDELATFIATTNTVGPDNLRLSVELYDPRFLGPDDFEELYKFVTWERVDNLSDYARIQRAYELNAGGGIYAVGATNIVTYPQDIILKINTREPECRNIAIGRYITLRQRGAHGVPQYSLADVQDWNYQTERPEAPEWLFPPLESNSTEPQPSGQLTVRITHMLQNGFICYDPASAPTGTEATEEPLPPDSEVLCAEAWRVDVDPQ